MEAAIRIYHGRVRRITYVATGLTAFVKIQSAFEEPIFERPRLLDEYLRTSRAILNGRVTLQPLLVVYKRSLLNKKAWFCELIAKNQWFLGHGDSLYEIKLDPKEIPPNALVDAVQAARTVQQQFPLDHLYLVRIRPSLVPKTRLVTVPEIEADMWKHEPPQQIRDDVDRWCSVRSGSGGHDDEVMWNLVEVLFTDVRLLYAALFLRTSYRELMFRGDDTTVVAEEPARGPTFIYEAVQAENAIHNAYKVIEALWGGTLPKRREDLSRGLEKRGFNPAELVGFRVGGIERQQLIDKIQMLQTARDERAAHGRVGIDRRSTYYQVMDFQGLAHAILTRYLQQKYHIWNSEEP